MSSLISTYKSINEFQNALSSQIKDIEQRIHEYSKKIGDKLRLHDGEIPQDNPFMQQINEIIEGTKDSKKDSKDSEKEHKKEHKKKQKKISKKKGTKWFDLDGLFIYDGLALAGELEVYFKAIQSLKQELENLRKIKESFNSLMEKGLKENLGCIVLQSNDSPPEIVLMKKDSESKKFSYNSIICVSCEPQKITKTGDRYEK